MKIKSLVICVFMFFYSLACAFADSEKSANPVIKLLRNIEYSSRLKFEYDSNIFFTEDNEESDFKEIFSQTLRYKTSQNAHYFEAGYKGNYAYFTEESLGILNHAADILYSYRPFSNLSFGIRDDYNWLQDSKIAATIGDRVLALGYTQNIPSLQVKYEINPRYTVTFDANYQFLDVRDGNNDDYIDNKRIGAAAQVNYSFSPEQRLVGFLGFEHSQITFPQVTEKAALFERPFLGMTQKINGLVHLTEEIGFENINMTDEANADDNAIDSKLIIESVFSVYTKLTLSLNYNSVVSSLRRQYALYHSNLAILNFAHMINPKTTFVFGYSYERQKFHASDVLVDQPMEDKETFIQGINLTLSRKLKSWLTLDFKYSYLKRDTDFAQEGYTDNQFSTALTAHY